MGMLNWTSNTQIRPINPLISIIALRKTIIGGFRLDESNKGSCRCRSQTTSFIFMILNYLFQMPFFSDYRERKGAFQSQQIEQQCEILEAVTPPPWSALGLPLRFSLTLGQSQGTDPTLIWSLNTPNPYRQNSDMSIAFPVQTIVMNNVATNSNYPTNIYIEIDNFNGYLDINGNQTGNAVKYGIKTITPTTTTPATYIITYQSQEISWYLPRTSGVLNFRVYYDTNQTAQTTPLPFQISLQLEIRKYPFDRKLQNERDCEVLDVLQRQMMMFY